MTYSFRLFGHFSGKKGSVGVIKFFAGVKPRFRKKTNMCEKKLQNMSAWQSYWVMRGVTYVCNPIKKSKLVWTSVG